MDFANLTADQWSGLTASALSGMYADAVPSLRISTLAPDDWYNLTPDEWGELLYGPETVVAQTVASGICRDGAGDPVSGVTFHFRLIDPGSQALDFWDTGEWTEVSDDNGLVSTSLLQSATYAVKSPGGSWQKFPTGANQTFSLAEYLGKNS